MWVGGLFPIAPDGDVAEVESVPVKIEHLRIESENALASYAGRRRNERGKTSVDSGAFGAGGAREKMPESEAIPGTGLGENGIEIERGRTRVS